MAAPAALIDLIQDGVRRPIAEPLRAVAEAARLRHGDCILAVLVYGSCLHEGDDDGKIVDLYLLADDYSRVHESRVMQRLNAWLPPNVYYLEAGFAGRAVRAKYAVVTLADFQRLVSAATLHPYFWARFAQPSALAWTRDETAETAVVAALTDAVITLISAAAPLTAWPTTAEAFWQAAFAATYRTELRAERSGRALDLYRADRDRYDQIFAISGASGLLPPAAVTAGGKRQAERQWRRRRLLGKLLSVLRLIKAAFTFSNGPDYLMWKIERHSGVRYQLSDWQRRHPLIAAPTVFWRLYRRGAFR